MDPLPDYVYEGLPAREAIRILILYPAINFQAPLEAHFEYNSEELSHDTTISSQGFDAISYCWGEPRFTHVIYFKNFSHGHIPSLAITANVDSMLRHLRKPHKERRLWIDAICINQADAEEKTLQVPLMRSIYTAASKVHVWLGAGGTFDAQVVFTYLKRIVVVDELEKETISLPNQSRKECAATQLALQQLFLNPWFTRRWVLQEIALAHEITVHYGYDKISWNWFAKGTLLLPELDEQHKTQCGWASYQPYKVAKKTIETSLKRELWLPDSLLEHVSAECSDPRDRLFALYGILGHNYSGSESAIGIYDRRDSSMPLQILPEVDYTKSWVETYKRLAENMIQLQPSEFWYHLQIFGSIREHQLMAPSWVPDWRQVNMFIQPRLLYSEIDVGTLVDSPNGRCLQLSGWLYGSVIKIWDISPQSQSHPADIVPDIGMRQHSVDGEPILQIQERLRQNLAYLLLLAANIINQKDLYADDLEPFWWALLDMETSQLFQSTLTNWLKEPYPSFTHSWPNNLSRIVNSVLAQSRVFRTMRKAGNFDLSYGTLGVTPADIEVGDVVFRCSARQTMVEWEYERDLKLVLRPTLHDNFKNAFKFVGFCFLKEDDMLSERRDYWTSFSGKDVVLV